MHKRQKKKLKKIKMRINLISYHLRNIKILKGIKL